MPFTFAHPGFILPIKKWKPAYFSTTGLVFGSIAPDMDIILRLTNQRFHIFQYDLKCVVLYIFPLAFVFSIYFHLVLRNIIIDHLPARLSEQYSHYKKFNYLHFIKSNLLIVILSIFIGIYLHLFLDFITHWNAMIFKLYGSILYQSMITGDLFYYGAIYLPPVLFSILGFYLILKANDLYLSDLIRSISEMARKPGHFFFYLTMAILALILTFIKTYFSGIEKKFILDSLIINATNGCMLSVLITTTLFYLRNKIKKVS